MKMLVESRIRREVYVRFGGECLQTYRSNTKRRRALSLQREGRILRQGNDNPKVEIFRYVTENTFDSYMWQTIEAKQKFMVRRILLNYEYTGALVRGKTCNYGVGMKPTKKRHESEWITVEDVNPPIVSKKLFARAGKVIQKQKADRCVIPHEYPLKGKLRCGNCRRALTHVLTDDTAFLICHNGLEIGKYSNCNVERYPAKEIEQVVWRVVRELICLLNKIGPKIQSKTEDKVQMLIAKEMELTRSIKQWKAEKLLQYELYADGSLSKELYLRNREELTERIERAEQTLTANQEKISKQRDLIESAEHLSGLSRMYLGETELTYEIAQAFVERVFVYNRNRIEIVFRFEDEIQRILQNEEEKKPQERIGA